MGESQVQRRVIWKYPLDLELHVAGPFLDGKEMPKGAEVLSFGRQDGQWVVWVMVDEQEMEYEKVWVEVYGTGWPLAQWQTGEGRRFLGTVQHDALVWHAFVLERPVEGEG